MKYYKWYHFKKKKKKKWHAVFVKCRNTVDFHNLAEFTKRSHWGNSPCSTTAEWMNV